MNITISGMVQGVGFRYAAYHAAMRSEIKGFVRNLSDGNVYIEAEGDLKNLNDFIAWCHKGPSHARVAEVVIREGLMKDFKEFIIQA